MFGLTVDFSIHLIMKIPFKIDILNYSCLWMNCLRITHEQPVLKMHEVSKYYIVYVTSTCWLVMFLMLLRDIAKRQFQNIQNKFHLDIKRVSEANS